MDATTEASARTRRRFDCPAYRDLKEEYDPRVDFKAYYDHHTLGREELRADWIKMGSELKFDPKAIWFYGAKNEEYKNWNPVGKSPLITVVDRSTGAVIAETRFPGSC